MPDSSNKNTNTPKDWPSPELVAIRKWLEEVEFKKQPLGGLSEVDVWAKLEKLNVMYELALRAERTRFNSLLEGVKKDRTLDGSD